MTKFADGMTSRLDLIVESKSIVEQKELAKELDLPERISASALLKLINSYMTYDEYKNVVRKVKKQIENVT